MASIKSVYLTYIFDLNVIQEYISVYPISYKYVLYYITFGDPGIITYGDQRGIIQLLPYRIYAILINEQKIISILPTEEHKWNLIIPRIDPTIGYTKIPYKRDGINYDIFQCNVFDKNTLYSLFILERPKDVQDIIILSDNVNFRNQIIKTSNESSLIVTRKRYTAFLLVHERQDIQITGKVPSRYMISYIYEVNNRYSYSDINEEFVFIDNALMSPTPQVMYSMLQKYVPEFEIDISDFDLSFLNIPRDQL